MESESEYIESITPDVMGCLEQAGFFTKLDDILCPMGASSPDKCSGSYAISERILDRCGFDSDDKADIFAVMHSLGGCCDCEILYNVVEESRLKATYWKNKVARKTSTHSHHRSDEG